MRDFAHHLWITVRGPLLALLGLAAAVGVWLLLDGWGWGWQAGLGLVSWIITVVAVGRLVRVGTEDAVEESAAAVYATAAFAFQLATVLLLAGAAVFGACTQANA